jgi:hypothetical protein
VLVKTAAVIGISMIAAVVSFPYEWAMRKNSVAAWPDPYNVPPFLAKRTILSVEYDHILIGLFFPGLLTCNVLS